MRNPRPVNIKITCNAGGEFDYGVEPYRMQAKRLSEVRWHLVGQVETVVLDAKDTIAGVPQWPFVDPPPFTIRKGNDADNTKQIKADAGMAAYRYAIAFECPTGTKVLTDPEIIIIDTKDSSTARTTP